MNYRLAKPEDIPKINALCEKSGIPNPNYAICYVAEKDGEIISYVNGGNVNFIVRPHGLSSHGSNLS